MYVFTYGSLMFDRVWQAVVGRQPTAWSPAGPRAAVLNNYARRSSLLDSYPVAVPCAGETIWGRVYCRVAAEDILRLDQFEGAMYQRKCLPVCLIGVDARPQRLIQAAVYVLKPRYHRVVCERPWLPTEFEANQLSRLLRGIR